MERHFSRSDWTYVGGLGGEEDDLVELGKVGKEVVGTRALGRAPSVLELWKRQNDQRTVGMMEVGDKNLTSQAEWTSMSSRSTTRV